MSNRFFFPYCTYSKRLVFNFMQFVLIVIKATRRFQIFDRKRQINTCVFSSFFKLMHEIVAIIESFHHNFFFTQQKIHILYHLSQNDNFVYFLARPFSASDALTKEKPESLFRIKKIWSSLNFGFFDQNFLINYDVVSKTTPCCNLCYKVLPEAWTEARQLAGVQSKNNNKEISRVQTSLFCNFLVFYKHREHRTILNLYYNIFCINTQSQV